MGGAHLSVSTPHFTLRVHESVPETETQLEKTGSSEITLNRGRTCRCLHRILPSGCTCRCLRRSLRSGCTCRCLYNILPLVILCLIFIVFCILRDIVDCSDY